MLDDPGSTSPDAHAAPDTYAYSLNEEAYTGNFTSRDAALAEGLREHAPEDWREDGTVTVWTGRCIPINLLAASPLNGECVIDDLLDNLDEAGDYVLDGVTRAQHERLTAALRGALDGWLRAEGFHDRYFTVDRVERHDVLPAAPPAGVGS